MDRLLRNAGGKISITVYDDNNAPIDATGNVPVTIKDGAGTTVTSGNATKPANTTGIYEFTITPTHAANLDTYKAVWTPTVGGNVKTFETYFEVTGGFYFTIAEARAFDKKSLLSETQYPTADIVNLREQIEEDIERECGVSFVPRGRRLTLNGTGLSTVLLPNFLPTAIYSLSVDGTAYTSTELTDLTFTDFGLLTRKELGSFTYGTSNVSIYYAHGYPQVPEPVKRAALLILKHRLIPSDIDSRSLNFTDELGTRQFAQPGKRFPFGVPEADAILHRYSEKFPAIA